MGVEKTHEVIRYTGEQGGDLFLIGEAWDRVEPSQVSARGGTQLTIHGAAIANSTALFCVERSESQTLVTKANTLGVSGSMLYCPTPEWGRFNAAGFVQLSISNDDRFSNSDINSDGRISFAKFKSERSRLALDDLDAAQLARLFRDIDANSDLHLSFDEFWSWAARRQNVPHSSSLNVSDSILFQTTINNAAHNVLSDFLLLIGGQILHIYGLGLDAHVNYTCTFIDRSSPTHKAESTGSVTNSTYMTCATYRSLALAQDWSTQDI